MQLVDPGEPQMSIVLWDEIPESKRDYWHSMLTQLALPPAIQNFKGLDFNIDAFEPQQLSLIIGRDPILAGKILAVANSAAFGPRKNINSLQRAMIHLGFNLVKCVINTYLLESVFRNHPGYPRNHLDYIRRWSAGAAVAAFHFAGGKTDKAQMLSTATLLSKLGALVVGLGEPIPGTNYRAVPNEKERLAFEQLAWGVITPDLSHRLALHWDFPEPLPTLMQRHWEPYVNGLPPTEENRNLVIIAASLALTASYLEKTESVALTILDRQANAVLKANLDQQGIYANICDTWSSTVLQREIAAAVG
jgi:HD-like signal output (HDOD) protein